MELAGQHASFSGYNLKWTFITADSSTCQSKEGTCVTDNINDGTTLLNVPVGPASEPACTITQVWTQLTYMESSHHKGSNFTCVFHENGLQAYMDTIT